MPKLRKMLGSANSPYILSLMGLIETQSKSTLADWCINYAEKYFLPIYVKVYPNDVRPIDTLVYASKWLEGTVKLPEAK